LTSSSLLKECDTITSHTITPPLGAWEAIDQLSRTIQPAMNVSESEHYESVKIIVEVYKASGVNFALLCTHTVDMAMKTLHSEGKIGAADVPCGKYKDGAYFTLDAAYRALVDETSEEINISVRLLSLASKNYSLQVSKNSGTTC